MNGFVSKDNVLHILMEIEESVTEIEKNIGSRMLMNRIEKEVKIEAVLEQIDKELDELALCIGQSEKIDSVVPIPSELSVKCL
ncbi:YppD family protein [Bacillus gobiensis]|uniref:YppD family protein n=1 Tax=Bacillus gobiensis TaxID=1441095 RepID=UPI003D23067D